MRPIFAQQGEVRQLWQKLSAITNNITSLITSKTTSLKKQAVNKNAIFQYDSGSLILWLRILNPYLYRHHSQYYLFGVIQRAFWIKNLVIQVIWLMFSIFSIFSMFTKLTPWSPIWAGFHNMWSPDIRHHHLKQHATSTTEYQNHCSRSINIFKLRGDFVLYL